MMIYLFFYDISGLEEIVQDTKVVDGTTDLVVGLRPVFFLADALHEFLCGFGIVPESGGMGFLLFFSDGFQFAIDVKDAPLALPSAP
jgi:hypothetical protein